MADPGDSVGVVVVVLTEVFALECGTNEPIEQKNIELIGLKHDNT